MSKNDVKNVLWRARKRNAIGLPWTFTVYYFTEERLFIQTGFLRVEENEVRLYRVLDITWKKSLWQRIFGLGSIILQTADRSSPTVVLKNIRDSRSVKEQLSELVEQNRERKRVMNREYMSYDDDGDDALDDDDI